MTIAWDAKLAIGDESIDNDHKQLISLINAYENAVAKKDIRLLDEAFAGLEVYAREHFEREEKLMEAVFFPQRRPHKESHQALLWAVQDKHKQVRLHQNINLKELSEFLRHWLIDHVLKEDMQLKTYLAGRQ